MLQSDAILFKRNLKACFRMASERRNLQEQTKDRAARVDHAARTQNLGNSSSVATKEQSLKLKCQHQEQLQQHHQSKQSEQGQLQQQQSEQEERRQQQQSTQKGQLQQQQAKEEEQVQQQLLEKEEQGELWERITARKAESAAACGDTEQRRDQQQQEQQMVPGVSSAQVKQQQKDTLSGAANALGAVKHRGLSEETAAARSGEGQQSSSQTNMELGVMTGQQEQQEQQAVQTQQERQKPQPLGQQQGGQLSAVERVRALLAKRKADKQAAAAAAAATGNVGQAVYCVLQSSKASGAPVAGDGGGSVAGSSSQGPLTSAAASGAAAASTGAAVAGTRALAGNGDLHGAAPDAEPIVQGREDSSGKGVAGVRRVFGCSQCHFAMGHPVDESCSWCNGEMFARQGLKLRPLPVRILDSDSPEQPASPAAPAPAAAPAAAAAGFPRVEPVLPQVEPSGQQTQWGREALKKGEQQAGQGLDPAQQQAFLQLQQGAGQQRELQPSGMQKEAQEQQQISEEQPGVEAVGERRGTGSAVIGVEMEPGRGQVRDAVAEQQQQQQQNERRESGKDGVHQQEEQPPEKEIEEQQQQSPAEKQGLQQDGRAGAVPDKLQKEETHISPTGGQQRQQQQQVKEVQQQDVKEVQQQQQQPAKKAVKRPKPGDDAFIPMAIRELLPPVDRRRGTAKAAPAAGEEQSEEETEGAELADVPLAARLGATKQKRQQGSRSAETAAAAAARGAPGRAPVADGTASTKEGARRWKGVFPVIGAGWRGGADDAGPFAAAGAAGQAEPLKRRPPLQKQRSDGQQRRQQQQQGEQQEGRQLPRCNSAPEGLGQGPQVSAEVVYPIMTNTMQLSGCVMQLPAPASGEPLDQLPPLQPGELRALGQTIHPKLVEDYLKVRGVHS